MSGNEQRKRKTISLTNDISLNRRDNNNNGFHFFSIFICSFGSGTVEAQRLSYEFPISQTAAIELEFIVTITQ